MILSKVRQFLRPTPNVTNIVVSGAPTDQAIEVLTKAIVVNSKGVARKRILAALEALRSAVKTTPSGSA